MNCVFIVPYFATNDKILITNVKNDKIHVEKIQERHFLRVKQKQRYNVAGGGGWALGYYRGGGGIGV
jgi:hypothetical protein